MKATTPSDRRLKRRPVTNGRRPDGDTCFQKWFAFAVIPPAARCALSRLNSLFCRLKQGIHLVTDVHPRRVSGIDDFALPMHYNFARIHQTLRVTPAMEAGITDHVWGLDEIVQLISSGQPLK